MKTILQTLFLCFIASCNYGQNTNTISSGLNQNDVNVVRDGDYPAENGGVIKMMPNGKKSKVMTIVPDSVDGKPLNSSTATLVPATGDTVNPPDTSIKFKENKTRAASPNKKSRKPAGTKTKPK